SRILGSGFQWVDLDFDEATADDAYFVVYNQSSWVGNYDLVVDIIPRACAADRFEAGDGNDGWQDASPITLVPDAMDARRASAFVENLTVCTVSGGEQDWYAIDLSPGDRVLGTFFSNPEQGQLDFVLRTPGPAGANASGILQSVIGPESGERFVGAVDFTVPSDGELGEYLLQVQPQDPSGNNDFDSLYFMDFQVLRACPEDGLEPSSQATPFSLTDAAGFDTAFPFTQELALCRDEDWYAIEVPADRTVTACIEFVHEQGDMDFFLYDSLVPVGPDNLPTGLVDQSRQNIAPEVVQWTNGPSVATYYLRVALDVNEPERNTTYTLRLSDDSTCPCGPMCFP
ncbi:MAG: hypothetical protein AAF658_14780, partial [Myxococcota bacterium]